MILAKPASEFEDPFSVVKKQLSLGSVAIGCCPRLVSGWFRCDTQIAVASTLQGALRHCFRSVRGPLQRRPGRRGAREPGEHRAPRLLGLLDLVEGEQVQPGDAGAGSGQRGA